MDDHPNFRQALGYTLAFIAPHWSIVEAGNGQEGLTLAQRMHPDLIRLDLHMPVMDGYEMVVALQSDPTLAAIPRVLLTSEGLDHPLVVRLRLLCQAVVSKPFSIPDLTVRFSAYSISNSHQRSLLSIYTATKGSSHSFAPRREAME